VCNADEKKLASQRHRALPSTLRIRAFQESLLAWFRCEGRRFPWRKQRATRYVQVVSEVLLQRTRAETVSAVFPLFLSRYSGWRELALASDGELAQTVRPLGLWRQRVTTLRNLGAAVSRMNGRFPNTRERLEKLPGVGQYIASAILNFSHQGMEPLLDCNMARVLERCFGARELADIRYDPWLQKLSRRVVNHESSKELNWAILDLAAVKCHPRDPACVSCPIRAVCATGKRQARARAFSQHGYPSSRIPRLT
jgi:A/G-specific adenine glycosylase